MSQKPDAGYGYVLCEVNDPKRSHWWSKCAAVWLDDEGCRPGCTCRSCGAMTYRKPVEIPEGWELVPEGETILSGDCYITERGIDDCHSSLGFKAGKTLDKHGGSFFAFIRRKAEKKEEVTGWIKVSDRVPTEPCRVVAVNHNDGKPHCTDWTGSEFRLNPKPFLWMPLPPIPEKSPAEKAFEKWEREQGDGVELADKREYAKSAYIAAWNERK